MACYFQSYAMYLLVQESQLYIKIFYYPMIEKTLKNTNLRHHIVVPIDLHVFGFVGPIKFSVSSSYQYVNYPEILLQIMEQVGCLSHPHYAPDSTGKHTLPSPL